VTDQRKNSNDLFRFFSNDRDYVEGKRAEREEAEGKPQLITALVAGVLDKQSSERALCIQKCYDPRFEWKRINGVSQWTCTPFRHQVR